MTTVRTRVLRAATLVVVAALVPACSDSTGPSDPTLVEVDAVLAEADQLDLSVLPEMGVGVSPPVAMLVPDGGASSACAFDAGSQSFVCPAVTVGGITVQRSFTLYDAAGNTQASFDRATTAAIRTKSAVKGTLTSPLSTAKIDRADDRTVSGLLTSRHVLNGTSTSSTEHTFSSNWLLTGPGTSVPGTLKSTEATTISNLVLPSRDNRWPGPGTITSVATADFGDDAPLSPMTRRAEFTGTKCVVVTMTVGTYTSTRTMDLSNPRATSCTP